MQLFLPAALGSPRFGLYLVAFAMRYPVANLNEIERLQLVRRAQPGPAGLLRLGCGRFRRHDLHGSVGTLRERAGVLENRAHALRHLARVLPKGGAMIDSRRTSFVVASTPLSSTPSQTQQTTRRSQSESRRRSRSTRPPRSGRRCKTFAVQQGRQAVLLPVVPARVDESLIISFSGDLSLQSYPI